MSATEQGLHLTAEQQLRPTTVEYPAPAEVAQMRERFLDALPAGLGSTESRPTGPTLSPLARGIEEFNGLFGYDLRLPIDEKTLESAAMIAQLRGQPVLADALRAALPQAMEVVR